MCSECGTVVDSIYATDRRSLEFTVESFKERISVNTRNFGKLDIVSQKYLAILEEIRCHPYLYIDSDSFNKYLALGKRVKVIKRRARTPRDETLSRIVSIMNKYPKLCSRTDRAKYAIATIAYMLATNSSINMSNLSKELGLSKTHIARLFRVVRESQSFLSEVREMTRTTALTAISY